MPLLFFEGISRSTSFFTDESESFRIEGRVISSFVGVTVATHHDGAWHSDDKPYRRIVCRGALSVSLEYPPESTTEFVRPLKEVHIDSGTIKADGVPLATFNSDGQWHNCRTGQRLVAINVADL
jgi:hypothetical protein